MAEEHQWGTESLERIGTLDERWKKVLDDALRSSPFDLRVLWGFRGEDAQNQAFTDGHSTKRWPNSRHNTFPSVAVDVVPLVDGQIPWQDVRPWIMMAGIILGIARTARIPMRWGGNWDRDEVIIVDQGFDDLGHFEILDN
jgi:hypothetical protein